VSSPESLFTPRQMPVAPPPLNLLLSVIFLRCSPDPPPQVFSYKKADDWPLFRQGTFNLVTPDVSQARYAFFVRGQQSSPLLPLTSFFHTCPHFPISPGGFSPVPAGVPRHFLQCSTYSNTFSFLMALPGPIQANPCPSFPHKIHRLVPFPHTVNCHPKATASCRRSVYGEPVFSFPSHSRNLFFPSLDEARGPTTYSLLDGNTAGCLRRRKDASSFSLTVHYVADAEGVGALRAWISNINFAGKVGRTLKKLPTNYNPHTPKNQHQNSPPPKKNQHTPPTKKLKKDTPKKIITTPPPTNTPPTPPTTPKTPPTHTPNPHYPLTPLKTPRG